MIEANSSPVEGEGGDTQPSKEESTTQSVLEPKVGATNDEVSRAEASTPNVEDREGSNPQRTAHAPETMKASEEPIEARQAVERREVEPNKIDPDLMSPREEVGLKITEGFQGLGDTLGAIDRKLSEQNEAHKGVAGSLAQIPPGLDELRATSQQGLDVMQSMSKSLENQTSIAVRLVRDIEALGGAIEAIPKAIDRLCDRVEVQEEQHIRLSAGLADMRQTLASMNDGQREGRRETLEAFRESQETQRAAFAKARDEEREALRALVDKTHQHGRLITFVLVLVFIAFLGLMSRL